MSEEKEEIKYWTFGKTERGDWTPDILKDRWVSHWDTLFPENVIYAIRVFADQIVSSGQNVWKYPGAWFDISVNIKSTINGDEYKGSLDYMFQIFSVDGGNNLLINACPKEGMRHNAMFPLVDDSKKSEG